MKYLNGVLTLIAFCLLVITFSSLGIIQSAKANGSPRLISVPVNPDGSINVRLVKNSTIDVNIDEINGHSIYGGNIPVNIDEIDGDTPDYPLKVEVRN